MKKKWLFASLMLFCTLIFAWSSIQKPVHQIIVPKDDLPTVGSVDKLRTLLEEAANSSSLIGQGMMLGSGNSKSADNNLFSQSTTIQGASEALRDSASSDYSTTNTQVEGVDESDILKSDGEYIYQLNGQELIVTHAYPSDQLSVVSRIAFQQNEFTPRELYTDDKYIVLIGHAYYQNEVSTNTTGVQSQPQADALKTNIDTQTQDLANSIYPPNVGRSTTKVIIYDLQDKSNLKKLREVELQGTYVSSRKIGSSLYFIANNYINTYAILDQNIEPILPSYRDTAMNDNFATINYSDLHYFPNFVDPGYLLVGSLNLDKNDTAMQISSYLGSGQNIYASTSNLYVAVNQYAQINVPETNSAVEPVPLPTPEEPVTSPSASIQSSTQKAITSEPTSIKITTALYKFALTSEGTEFSAQGEVPGTILNQYSMDEYNGYFRIATTKGEIWRSGEATSKNNVYILDPSLQVTGKIEDIAPGERIYSVRFMGERGYMVTYRNTDPFFVIELKDPANPKILGALKIPGYSDYLHPYDENHVIGFGKDTTEVTNTTNGSTTAYMQGIKLALFDVTDVTHPQEMFKTSIGDRGTDSEALHNPKAFLFDKEKGLLSFPVAVMEYDPSTKNFYNPNGYPRYTFQGAYVYQLDLEKGFTLRGRITHFNDSTQINNGQYSDSTHWIERVLYIKDTLYTVSKKMIKANDLMSLQEKHLLIVNP